MIKIPIKMGVSGFMRKMEAWTPIYAEDGTTIIGEVEGSRRTLANVSPNLILNSGLNIMDQNSTWFDWCQVGLSDDAPVNTQTSLQTWFAGTNQLADGVPVATGAQAVAPFYGWKEKVFRFPALVGPNQILKEVGTGWGDGSGGSGNLTTRALIVDITGTPIAPAWKTGELLDVTYQLRYYPPLIDKTGTQDFNGVTYNYILRAAAVTSTEYWAAGIGTAMSQLSSFASDWRAGDGDIGTIEDDGPPTGLFADCDNADQYNIDVAPQYTIGVASDCGSAGWNLVAGIRSLRFRTTAGSYQIQFGEGAGATGNTIPKTAAFSMFTFYELTWAAGTIP